jgi:hypothetical protein
MRRLAVALAAVAAMALAAPAAQADHIAPSVTATLELGDAVRDCSASGLCARARRATVSWNASCGPAAPADALGEVDVGIYGVAPDGKRFGYDGEALEAEDATLTGSMRMTAGPGVRFFGEVTVTWQAGQYAQIEYFLRYSASSLTRRGVPELRQLKFFARGAGVRKKASADRGMLNQLGALGTWVNPRRAGTLRIWATIGGHRTNTLRIRVLPKRC